MHALRIYAHKIHMQTEITSARSGTACVNEMNISTFTSAHNLTCCMIILYSDL